MGIYHYKMHIVPRGIEPLTDDVDYWRSAQPESTALDEYRSILPNNTSWGNTEEFRSKDKYGSVLYVWTTDGRVTDLEIELAPGDWDTLSKICNVASTMNCQILVEESKQLLYPSIENIRLDWKTSTSAKFCRNPEQTIVDQARKLKDS